MQFLTLSRRRSESFSDQDIVSRLEEEVEAACALYSAGIIRQIWHRGDMPGACLLLEAQNENEARAALETLPLVQLGMLEITAVVPLTPYAGFAQRRRSSTIKHSRVTTQDTPAQLL